LKNIEISTKFKQSSLKAKIYIATTIMVTVLVSIGGNNANLYNTSTSSANKNIQVLGNVVKQPVSVYKTQYGVTTSSVNIRTGASTANSIQGTFDNKTNINIIATCGGFYKVSYSGKTGYVSNQYVKIIAKPVVIVTPQTVYKTQYGVTTSIVNIRTGASTANSIQGTFANKTNINIIATCGGFYKVSYNGKTGYVSNQYVKMTAKPVVIVPVGVTSISLNKTIDTLITGSTDTLTSIITPSNAVNKDVTWKSSNVSVATVGTTGKVTALNLGTATITATTVDKALKATCTVTVNNLISDNTNITSKFTDSNFKTKVYSLIGKASPAPILYSDIKKITDLKLDILNINNLSGIEYFTALTDLKCNSNKLTTLDLSKNTSLIYLDCGDNKLTTLNLSKNTALTSLECDSNNLTTLDLSKHTSLIYLNCYYNKLTTLDLTKNTALTSLGCGSNNLTTLDLSKNTVLTDLECDSNKLTTLDLSINTALTDLGCDSNNLTTLNLSKNKSLTYLYCYNNKLTTLDLSINTALIELECDSNKLTTLDISKNTALTYLNCSSNNLTTLYSIKDTWDTYNYRPQYTDSTHTTSTNSWS